VARKTPPTVDQWKATLDDLRRWLGPVHIVFTGGEALLVPFAPELVAYGSTRGLRIEHLTHGYWLDQSRIERMARGRPWRVTISFDGVGATHDLIRGREHFFNAVATTLATLKRVRAETGQRFMIRLKTVVMDQNVGELSNIAGFAREHGLEVFYQPIEQNYNSPDDSHWFDHSPTWPKDTGRAGAAVERLIALKRQGYPIANTFHQLEVMIPYFRDPDSLRVLTQAHAAHDQPLCAALTMLQIQSNGDVRVCASQDPVGNIKDRPIHEIWRNRPRYWESGCCFDRRMSDAEKTNLALEQTQGSAR
jgi:MoaA/NifB/PqqE/SkfB family radical SAM enzyme